MGFYEGLDFADGVVTGVVDSALIELFENNNFAKFSFAVCAHIVACDDTEA
jgi:hypothetical protein